MRVKKCPQARISSQLDTFTTVQTSRMDPLLINSALIINWAPIHYSGFHAGIRPCGPAMLLRCRQESPSAPALKPLVYFTFHPSLSGRRRRKESHFICFNGLRQTGNRVPRLHSLLFTVPHKDLKKGHSTHSSFSVY